MANRQINFSIKAIDSGKFFCAICKKKAGKVLKTEVFKTLPPTFSAFAVRLVVLYDNR